MSEPLTLTPDELVELTDYHQGARQIEWLDRHGVPHFVGRDGRPRVLRAALLQSKIEPPARTPRLRL